MHILTKLSPNNKFQIKAYRLADGYRRSKKTDDNVELRESNYIAQIQQKIESINKIVKLSSDEESFFYSDPKVVQKDLFDRCNDVVVSEQEIEAKACIIPERINLYKEALSERQKPRAETISYYELMKERVRLLDILTKSQQNTKPSRPWGKATRPKAFRWQGAQRILEGGAIIDRYCRAKHSSMVTVTLPGDTWYAMDAVARWSGWIVNRMCQVFRRIPKYRPPVYWFFVWEHQKRGALHMHWCIGWVVSQEERESLCEKIKDKWFQCLKELSEKEKIDMFAGAGFAKSHKDNPSVWQWDIQQIKKSVAGYFAKYCQKNSQLNGEKSNETGKTEANGLRRVKQRTTSRNRTYPTRYWGSSQNIKNIAKRLTSCSATDLGCYESGERACEAIRASLPRGASFRSVSAIPFEVKDRASGIVIASGVTETYIVDAAQFPAFHRYVSEYILNRPWCMDAFWEEFQQSGASMHFDINGDLQESFMHPCV